MFSKDYTLRYSDIDSNNKIKFSSILDLLQDVSICHSDHMNYTRERLAALSVAWLLSIWKIIVKSPIDNKAPLTVKTAITNFNKYQVIRKYEIWQSNCCKVTAAAEWFTVDTGSHRIAKIPEEIKDYYTTIIEEHNGIEVNKLRGRDDLTEIEQIIIKKSDIDTNNHLNNVKSAEILLNYVPDDFSITELQVTYKKQLFKNDIGKICTKTVQNSFFGELRNENNEPCILLSVKNDNDYE